VTSAPVLAVVLPCLDEAEVLFTTAGRLAPVVDELIRAGSISDHSFVLFVDDGSSDATWELIADLCSRSRRFRGLRLSRNFGHQYALLAGLLAVRSEAHVAITLDADLQHDEQAIPRFIERFAAGDDVVLGVRRGRATDGLLKRATAAFYYRLMRLLGADVVPNHADFRLMSRRALDALARYPETNLFLRGILPGLGFRTSQVAFDVRERAAGRSKYSGARMIALALSGITSFSIVPIRLVTVLGLAIFAFSFAMIAYALAVRLVLHSALPGWASTVVPIYLLGGIQLFCLGLIGEYVGRIYLEVKRRPRFIVEEALGVMPPRDER
jgi:glycosyltransferase involved in cell wall biosynthesis